MKKLINKLELTLILIFKVQNKLDKLELSYDEDQICELKSEFLRRYKLVLTEDEVEYIINI
jgi:hypothetical protein